MSFANLRTGVVRRPKLGPIPFLILSFFSACIVKKS